jgi:hypothetical protein
MDWNSLILGVSGIVVSVITFIGTRDKRNQQAPRERDEARAYAAELATWGYKQTIRAAVMGVQLDPMPKPPGEKKNQPEGELERQP